MSNNFGFKIYYGLVFLTCLGLLAMKLITSFWIPEWSYTFYLVSAVLGAFAIWKVLLKTIRLRMAEHRFGKQLIVLPALHYEERRRNPFTFKRVLATVAVYAVVFSSLGGGGFYVYRHVLAPLQSIPASACASPPTAMPAVLNNAPPLEKWQHEGNATATFTFTKTGGFFKKASLTIHSTDGTSTWVYPAQAALAGNTYQYANWYNADVQTVLALKYVLDGKTTYQTIDPHIPATKGWRHYSVTFDMPGNPGESDVLPVSVAQEVIGKGNLEISDVVLHPQTSAFVRPMISLTFDDGWRSQYSNALGLLCKYRVPATFYLVSSYIERGFADYMLPGMVKKLADSGMEIGDHTVDHPHLPTLSTPEVEQEITDSKEYLEQFGQKVVDFASPYGEVTDEDIHLIQQVYQSHRTTDVGLNDALEFNPYNIYCITIDTAEHTSLQAIEHWIDQAIAAKAWIVLAFHQMATPDQKYYNDPFNASPAFLEQILSYIRDHHIEPMTMSEALSEIDQQI